MPNGDGSGAPYPSGGPGRGGSDASVYDPYSTPDFHNLPLMEKDKVLRASSPEYKSMSPQEQQKVLNAVHYGAGQPEESGYKKLVSGVDPDVEQWADKHPVMGPAARFGAAATGAVIGLPEATLDTVMHPEQTYEGLKGSVMDWVDPNTRPTLKQTMSVLPEALGLGTGNAVAGEAIKALHDPAAKVVRTEEGTGPLRKPVRMAATGAGGAVGYGVGRAIDHPYLGVGVGLRYGAKAADEILPRISKEGRLADQVQTTGASDESGEPEVIHAPAKGPTHRITPEQVPMEDLKSQVARGTKGAGQELSRRGKTVLYESGEDTPRNLKSEVVTWDKQGNLVGGPEGEPSTGTTQPSHSTTGASRDVQGTPRRLKDEAIGEASKTSEDDDEGRLKPQIAFTTDKNGTRWAIGRNGVKVSVKPGSSMRDVRNALDNQAEMQAALRARLNK